MKYEFYDTMAAVAATQNLPGYFKFNAKQYALIKYTVINE